MTWLLHFLAVLAHLLAPSPHVRVTSQEPVSRYMNREPVQVVPLAWQRLAGCESGSRWNADTGNGFYGGVQFTTSTWLAFGGGRYATRADLATPFEQVLIGSRVLVNQGVRAWPVCGPEVGLTVEDAVGVR